MVYHHSFILAGLAFILVLSPGNVIPGNEVVLSQTVVIATNQERLDSGLPVRLTIRTIKVDAVVESVGLTSIETMDTPKDPINAGWFNLGPRPGEIGNAVIAGHFGWKNSTPAVFDNLHTLNPGDTVSVDDENGVTTTFVVREIRIYSENDSASEVFSSTDGKAHLNLITCKGVWDADLKRYPDRLVVFTDEI